MITEKDILQALTHVEDPDFKKDVVSLGMIRNIRISGNQVAFDFVLTTPACPMKDMLENAARNALLHMVSQDLNIEINMTSEVKSNRVIDSSLSHVKNVIAVASGKGGVGKSTVAATLARILAQSGAQVGLMDADIYGPSQPILTGTQGYKPQSKQEGEKNLMEPAIVEGVKVFSIGYLVENADPIAWRGPMLSSAIKQFIQDVAWGTIDYLIIDLPPGTGDVQITLSQALKLTGAVVVTTPQNIALADARRAIHMFQLPGLSVPILGVIENMAWFQTPDVPNKAYYIFGKEGGKKLAEETQVPFLGEIPLFEDLPGSEQNGSIWHNNTSTPFFYKIVGNLVRSIAQNANQSPSPTPK